MGIQIIEYELCIELSIILVQLCASDMSITVHMARLVNLGYGRLICELSLLSEIILLGAYRIFNF
jgi:hypothetical protein